MEAPRQIADHTIASARVSRIVILLVLCAAFVIRQFYGTIIAGIAPAIVAEFDITPDALGRLTSYHLLAFAAMQVPVGVLFDRFGPRPIMSTLILIAAVGSFLFASTSNARGLAMAYTLIGIGLSGTLMGAILVMSDTFPLRRIGSYTSIVIAAGGVGTMISATPVAWVSDWLGWRAVFLVMGGITGGVAALLYLVLPPSSHDRMSAAHPNRQLLRGFGAVWSQRAVPRIITMSLLSFSTLSVIRGVWAGPYFHDVHGYVGVELGNALLIMSVGMVVGTLLYGLIDRLVRSRKRIVLGGAAASAAALLTLAVFDRTDASVCVLLLTLVGLAGPYDVILMAHARSIFSASIAGRGITTINISAIAGGAALQSITGLLIAELPVRFGMTLLDSYRIMFAIIGIAIFIAASVYAGIKDPGSVGADP